MPATGRVTGVEVLPTAVIGRPRVDVTWRISGLFRDLFPAQIALLDAAVQAVAARDETDEENPLAGARRAGDVRQGSRASSAPRPAPMAPASMISRPASPIARRSGQAYLDAASHAYGGAGWRRDGRAGRIRRARRRRRSSPACGR